MYKKWEEDLVGILEDDSLGSSNVFVNRQNVLQFRVRLISVLPESFPNISYFTGYSQHLDKYGFEEDYYAAVEDRVQSLKQFLRGQLIVFRPFLKNDFSYVDDARLVIAPLHHQADTVYTPVPVFSEKIHRMTNEDFLNRLRTGQVVGTIPHLSPAPTDTPAYLLWRSETEMEGITVVGEFDRHRLVQGGFLFSQSNLKTGAYAPEWEADSFEVPGNQSLIFMAKSAYQELTNMMAGLEVEPELPSPALPLASTTGHVSVVESSILIMEDVIPEPEVPDEEPSLEQDFLLNLAQMAREQGLLYDEQDLINFHTAMKISNLVILSGMSGTGKSKLVQLYARALGMDDEQLTFVPVRPSWTDDADLTGYVDSVHMVYRPGDSALVNTLVQAARLDSENRLYIICFDEMNLARVEHYFSQFLSVLELEPGKRVLRLYNEELEPRIYNSAQYPSRIPLGDNLLFVGTVNVDESTYHFSDKVLDRANVITLRTLPFAALRELDGEDRKRRDRHEWTATEYRSFIDTNTAISLTDRELAFLQELHFRMNAVNPILGVGYRVVRQINHYLANLPKNGALSRPDGFDRQVAQRILTKVRGPEEQMKPLVGHLKSEQEEMEGSSLLELFTEHADVSGFALSSKVVKQKAKELRQYGFTI